MAEATIEISVAASADDANYFEGTASTNGQWLTIGSHTTDSKGPWVGFRFLIDSALAAIDPDDITDVRVQLRSNVSGTFSGRWRVKTDASADAYATSGTNRADNRHNAIGSTGEVLQGSTSVGAAADWQSSDLSARVVEALGTLGEGDYLGITCGIDLSVAGNYYIQSASYDHVSAPAPKLIVTYDVDPVNIDISTTAPALTATAAEPSPVQYTFIDGTSYHDSTGDSTTRVLDALIPQGTPPAEGWPVVTWAHGGAWNSGNESNWVWDFARRSLEAGCAFISWTYKKTVYDIIFNTNTGFSRPNTISDGMAMLKWISTNAGTYDLDPDRIVMTGESAGAHLALEVALLHSDDDRDTYDMAYQGLSTLAGGANRRYAVYPDFAVTQGRDMSTVSIVGAALFAGPIDLTTLRAEHTGGSFEALWSQVLNAYYGAQPNSGDIMSSFDGEGDLNSHITGATGTIYEDRDATAPPWPILYIQASDDPVALIEGSYDALVAALDTAGYPTTASNGVVDPDGLTFRTYTDGGTTDQPHTRVMTNTTNLSLWDEWLEAILTSADADVTTTAPTVGFTTDGATGSADVSVTVTAPTVGLATDGATVTVDAGPTTTAANLGLATDGVTVSTAADAGVTTSAPTVGLATDGATASADASVTTSAVNLGLATDGATVSVAADGDVTTTAPSVGLATDGATVTADAGPTTTAPALGLATDGATVSTSADVNVTITAPTLGLSTDGVTVAAGGNISVTTVAPEFALATGVATVEADSGITIVAPVIGLTTDGATTSISNDVDVTTTAPVLGWSTDGATVSTSANASVTTTAPELGFEIESVTISGTDPEPNTSSGLRRRAVLTRLYDLVEAAIAELAVDPGITLIDGPPRNPQSGRLISIGEIRGQFQVADFRAGRKSNDDRFTIDVLCTAWEPGAASFIEVDTDSEFMGDLVCTVVADAVNLQIEPHGALAGVVSATIGDVDGPNRWWNPEGVGSAVKVEVNVHMRVH